MTKINLKVITNSNENKVFSDIIDENNIRNIIIKTTSTPVNFEANKSIIKILSKYLKVSKSSIKIVSGEKNSNKIIKII